MRFLSTFARTQSGASAAEYALVLPIMLLFLFGIIDAGRYAWSFNQAEKGAQMAVRMAVVTDFAASGLASANYVGSTACGTALTPGDPICRAALGTVSCGSTGACTCAATPCPATLTRDATAWNRIRDQVQKFAPWVSDSSIKVEYSGSGLGYAGDKDISIAPVVTVKLDNLSITPMTTFAFKVPIRIPVISRSLTMEDGKGAVSN